jgi:hypothetical protein
MQNIPRLIALAALITCTFALSACATRTDRIEGRQDARTSGVETRQDRYDARAGGRQDRRQILSDLADARYESW